MNILSNISYESTDDELSCYTSFLGSFPKQSLCNCEYPWVGTTEKFRGFQHHLHTSKAQKRDLYLSHTQSHQYFSGAVSGRKIVRCLLHLMNHELIAVERLQAHLSHCLLYIEKLLNCILFIEKLNESVQSYLLQKALATPFCIWMFCSCQWLYLCQRRCYISLLKKLSPGLIREPN